VEGGGTGGREEGYLHPFPAGPTGDRRENVAAWREGTPGMPFAAAMTAQHAACARDLAPRQRHMPDYAGALNYGYHLDAGAFARLLADHAKGQLGVTHPAATVTGADSAPLTESTDPRAGRAATASWS